LTTPNPQGVASIQPALNPQPQPQTEEDRCREDRERRRKPSNVIAKVKNFSRRMSQWSLDNLRRN
jgi:hypothetical protein